MHNIPIMKIVYILFLSEKSIRSCRSYANPSKRPRLLLVLENNQNVFCGNFIKRRRQYITVISFHTIPKNLIIGGKLKNVKWIRSMMHHLKENNEHEKIA